jgi:hypothetical protein
MGELSFRMSHPEVRSWVAMDAVSERMNRHSFRLTVVAVVVAFAGFVLAHDLEFDLAAAATATADTGTPMAHADAATAHSPAALCAVALVMGFSILGLIPLKRRRGSTRGTAREALPAPMYRPLYLSRSLLHELCVIRH